MKMAGAAICGVACLLAATHDFLPDDEMPFGNGIRGVFGDDAEEYKAVQPGPLPSVWDDSAREYRFGRYRRPPLDASLHPTTALQRYMQQKEWHWTAVAAGPLLIGVATTQFGYASHALLYIHDTATGLTDHVQLEVLLAGRAFGASFTHSSDPARPSTPMEGCSSWTFGGTVRQCAQDGAVVVEGDAVLRGGTALRVNLTLDAAGDDSLSFVYPIGAARPAVVSKMGGVAAAGTVEVDGERRAVAGVGLMDWTRSLAARFTKWYWTSVAFIDTASGARIGLHLSAGVYEDHNGNGVENCVFVNGVLHTLDAPVRFTPGHPGGAGAGWRVAAEDAAAGVAVDFEFTPAGSMHGVFHLFVLDGDLHHMWGAVSGTVTVAGRVYPMRGVPGVLEDHYALW
eukprot:TRINITY_DN8741_c0_g1_i1.p1 TRINITY_DN8741_c0_g1~~TRINITY_DN8741_c0_g1_i1.p1  ORF type:complete len:398 (+),score=125.70 TRINITY_DN8741_c0_g1_i1:63-1256(+)